MSRVVVLVLLVAISAILVLSLSHSIDNKRAEDAKKLFLDDLQRKYPNADVREIMDVTQEAGSNGSYYQLKARVSSNLIYPCPERLHIYYNYPPQNFVTQPPDIITRDCKLCINEPTCILAFEEEAIVASHTYPGTDAISSYINTYQDAIPTASFASEYDTYKNVWIVKWDSKSAPYSMKVLLSKTEKKPLATFSEAKQ
ncbi:Uncharacterised protein [Candidatus Anstonella stagnisolia]|nr:Uncharacterised protein [Candidatus Anstonella stagnisolia]